MAGCDYLDNIKGVSLIKVLRSYVKDDGPAEVKRLLETRLRAKELTAYMRNVDLAVLCFTHQLAYDPKAKRECDRLTTCDPNADPSDTSGYNGVEDYTGSTFRCVESYTKGERERQDSLVFREVEEVDFRKLLKFYAYIPRPGLGMLSNLTERTVRLDNFDEFEDMLDRSDNDEHIQHKRQMRKETAKKGREMVEKRRVMAASGKSTASASTAATRRKRMLKKRGKRVLAIKKTNVKKR